MYRRARPPSASTTTCRSRPRLSPALAAAAPPAGPRGVPGRRLLSPLPPAGAQRQAARASTRSCPRTRRRTAATARLARQASARARGARRAAAGRRQRRLPPAARQAQGRGVPGDAAGQGQVPGAPLPGHRRLADRAADHRDAGRRSLGVHPDQRDLDHRRPDLPRARPLLRRRAPRHQRRHQRLAASAATPRARR